MTGTCHYCGPTDRALRPYGPGGSTVCLPCVTATPERNAAAGAVFGTLLEAAAVFGPVVLDTEKGPVNLDPDDLGS